ncbi:hypothetical protein [Limnobacter sp.]|uniref:hypothetical protein n=1 Tax=Limnobacter sp. TaxID=2003368 RepID=UPI00351454F6
MKTKSSSKSVFQGAAWYTRGMGMASRDLLQKRLGKMLAARQNKSVQGHAPAALLPQSDLTEPLSTLSAPADAASDQAATVHIGTQARHLLDRTAFIRQIEAKLASHATKPLALRPYGLDRKPGELPNTWEDLDQEVEVRRKVKPISELKLGVSKPQQSEVACQSPASISKPVARGLQADLDTLRRLRQLNKRQAALLEAAGIPKPAQTIKTEASPAPPKSSVAPTPDKPSTLTPAATCAVEAFMATPAHLEWQSKSQLDIARFFMDELQVKNFRGRIESERTSQRPLAYTVYSPALQAIDFTANPRAAEAKQSNSALFNDLEFDAWIAELEQQFPPLYRQEQRVERVQVSQRTRAALKLLPMMGRNVTLGSLLNSWSMMGQMGRVRSLVVQPDFVRLDNQETLEHELFLGLSGLPAQRNHTLFKASEDDGYLSGSAIHLFRPRQLVAPHEDAEGFLTRVHPLLKRHFAQQAFTQWFDKIFTTSLSHTTLIESFVGDAVQRYASIQKKLLKQASVVSHALHAEFGQGQATLGGNPVFNMQFYQQHGFLPAPSFYEFLQCPVADALEGGNRPLWQVLGAGGHVHWRQIGIEEHPMDLVLLHVLAIYALAPVQNASLVKLMGLLDLLIRCGDYFGLPITSNNTDEQRAINKSLGLLQAYEKVLAEDLPPQGSEAQNSLGSYRFPWDRHTKQTPVDDAFLPGHQESLLVEAFHGLCKQMQAAGVWRNDIARLLQLSQLALATV